MNVTVIGAGLAGSECAWQLAQRGISVALHEMKPEKMTPQDEQSLRSAVDELHRVADEVLQEPQQ